MTELLQKQNENHIRIIYNNKDLHLLLYVGQPLLLSFSLSWNFSLATKEMFSYTDSIG